VLTVKSPRLVGWLIATLLLFIIIALLAPQQLPVSLYKLSLVTTAGVVGYWLDRSLFPYARPDQLMGLVAEDDVETLAALHHDHDDPDTLEHVLEVEATFDPSWPGQVVFGLAMLRRALIVGCAMLAMGLGA
jgi:hypothetical protein